MGTEERVLELAGTWWRCAAEDLRVAERVRDLHFACCFHAQQAVEKAIKCLLVLHQTGFRKLHDLGELLRLLEQTPLDPPHRVTEELEELTRYAVETRYPPGEASAEEAEQALRRARGFLEWVRRQLPDKIAD
jgi:HEPN domain-containing protein